ncbi:MAG TPA: 4'-phosphopantetheinyl transferase superfamily protein [Pseudoxanthomonas sp.]|nr:4'-phosphopantetheinyl transferase superfamily protein [Pseudoxanthomonas sp.]
MPHLPNDLPAHVRLLPHAPRAQGEPTVRPLLAQMLQCPPAAVPLWRDAWGRPRLGPPFQRLDVGWSHSGEALLLALGDGSVQLGVDIERLRERPRLSALARRFYHPDEAAWLMRRREDSRLLDFVRLWCAKEALLKAHGQGLSFGLHRLAFAEHGGALRLVACDAALGAADQWRLREWSPLPGYRAALAWRAFDHPAPAAILAP